LWKKRYLKSIQIFKIGFKPALTTLLN